MERRPDFSRHNLLHVWPSTIRDLTALGVKCFYPKFCNGGIAHISIRRLQIILLKIALLLNVRFYTGCSFQNVNPPCDGQSLWTVQVERLEHGDLIPQQDLQCNILIGADGENSKVAATVGFEKKKFKAGSAIAISSNLKNFNSIRETQIPEFGSASYLNQKFFNLVKSNLNLNLENCVYYREETHYMVLTIKLNSLLEKGILRENSNRSEILNPENIDREELKNTVRSVATFLGIPTECSFEISNGREDVSLFDFSEKHIRTCQTKFLQVENSTSLMVSLVGDALIEPFWPQGTGLNRAILSAMDAAWTSMHFLRDDTMSIEEITQKASESFKILKDCSPADLHPHEMHTMDPSTRYRRRQCQF